VDKPAAQLLGIPIIIITIVIFMTGYVRLVVSSTKQPDELPATPIASQQAPVSVAPVQEPAPGDSSGLLQAAMPADKEVKSWTGRFAGYVDNNLMVIYVGDEAKTFLFPTELARGSLAKGDEVSFEFFQEKNGQAVLSAIKKLVPSDIR